MNAHQTLPRGFTLIEVIIALAILAVALAATSRATHGSADSATALKTKQIALWVAQNRLAELQLSLQSREAGEHSGQAEQGGLRFEWKDSIAKTKNERISRVEITVHETATPDYAAAKLIGFLAEPQPPKTTRQ